MTERVYLSIGTAEQGGQIAERIACENFDNTITALGVNTVGFLKPLAVKDKRLVYAEF